MRFKLRDEPEEGLLHHHVGLCTQCQHVQVVKNVRGSVFFLCEKSKTDVRYEKYPAMPLIECEGYEKRS